MIKNQVEDVDRFLKEQVGDEYELFQVIRDNEFIDKYENGNKMKLNEIFKIYNYIMIFKESDGRYTVNCTDCGITNEWILYL